MILQARPLPLPRTAPPRHRRRRPARMLMMVLTLLCAVGLSALGPTRGPATAWADSVAPPDLLNAGQLSQGLYAATPAQLQSLQNLQQGAVSATISDHGLPASDAAAVRAWGRADAQAELWALLVQAIQTAPASRTADQQNAVAWLTTVEQREAVQAADAAGIEYVKWAGLDQTRYNTLVAGNASQSALQSFFNVTPINYNNAANPSASTGGYCTYAPPAPYQNEFSNRDNEDCFIPCTSVAGCIPTGPTYSQFVKWGAADADYASFNSSDFATSSRDIAIGVGVGAGIGAGVTGLAIGSALGVGTATGSGLTGITALLPFAGVGVTVVAIAGLVVIVIAAIAIGVVDAINVFNAAAVPGQLAALIASAPTTTPDLGAMLGDPTQTTGLFGLFVGATLPTPRPVTCDNTISGAGSVPCLNAPPIPVPATSDPLFAIQAKGATTTTYATSLSWQDAVAQTTTTARLSGHWFVDQVSGVGGTTTVTQTLRLHYTDWSGVGQTAWLLGDPTNGYKFLGIADLSPSGAPLNPSTCLADKTCAYSSAIDYVGTDGGTVGAAVIANTDTVAPTTSANPVQGSPMTFSANGSSSLGLAITDQWQFEIEGSTPGLTCPLDGGACVPDYQYTQPLAGAQVSHTWTTSGTFHVRLTATDGAGRQTVDTFTVAVGDVPPTLGLWPTAGTSDPFNLFCDVNFCDVHTVSLGGVTTLHGAITHAGSTDTEKVTVTWGDGARDTLTAGGSIIYPVFNLTLTYGSPTVFNLAATHTYTAAGSYPVTVAVSDQSGGTASTTTTETVQAATSVAWPAPAAITYGAPLGAAQLDAAASATLLGGPVSVPGTFAYSVDGSPVTAGDNKVLLAGAHTLTVQFTPTDTTLYTTPAPLSVPLTVNKAPLTLTADNMSKVYGQLNPAFTVSPQSLVNGDTLTALQGTLNVATTATQFSAPGPYALTPGGLSSPNYSISYGAGTLTITKDASMVTLTSSRNPAPFGQPVTLTASVGAAAPGAGTPTGSVTFLDGGTPIGTAPLAGGRASLTTATLLGGAHSLSVSYSGDTNFSAGTSAALAQAITFSRTLNGTVNGPQTVHAGEAVLISGTVNGPLTVQAGASVALVGAHVSGPLAASGAVALALAFDDQWNRFVR